MAEQVEELSLLNIDLSTDDLVLTTIDNPYNPKIDYDKWQQWDEDNGYNTESFIARLIDIDELIDIDDELRLAERKVKVINEILENDVLNIYVLV